MGETEVRVGSVSQKLKLVLNMNHPLYYVQTAIGAEGIFNGINYAN